MSEQNKDQPTAAPLPSASIPLLPLVFLGSGCAALIYEVVWLQLLQLVIGLTTVSLGLLLGVFMGGLCLGSVLLPRCVGLGHHPLRVFAMIEAGIGLLGVAVLFGLPLLDRLYTVNASSALTGIILRASIAVLCLLPPTLLMGATLPAISRWVEATREGVSWMGFFYAANIAGAVLGCLLAGFYLLRVHDVETATYVAASINGVVALTALGLSMCTKSRAVPGESTEPAPSREPGAWTVYGTIALSGLAALGAEVVWTRLLSLMLGATVYTFSIVLAVFLGGLGIGSGLGAALARSIAAPRRVLGCCQWFLVAGVAWAACAMALSLPYWPINPTLAQSPWHVFQLDLAMCLWTVLPAAILWGASFPLALASVAARGQDPGRLVGGIYAANTVGAILGALGFSLLVIPLLGTQWAQRLLIGCSATAAILAFLPATGSPCAAHGANPQPTKKGAIGIGIGLAVALALAVMLAIQVPAVPWGIVAYGRFMATYGSRLAPGIVSEEEVADAPGSADIYCLYAGEGLTGSVAVTKWKSGVRNFHSAGKVQASTEPRDMRLQRLLGHVSALLHPKPESVLVVACGAGVTAGTFTLYPETKRIVICDIEPLVPREVAPMFEKENYGVVNDPRTQVILDDGRHFIRTTKEKFDIITSDPIDPWVKGCAALNTVEYYEMCKAHLKPGGVMTVWIPLYESNLATAKSMIGSFFKVFPDGVIWSNDSDGEGYDAVLFGQAESAPIDIDKIQTRLGREAYEPVKKSLADVGFRSWVSLLATYAARAADLKDWLKDAQINTDHNLRLQYLAGLSLNTYRGSEILADIRQHYRFPDRLFSGSDRALLMVKYAIDGLPQDK